MGVNYDFADYLPDKSASTRALEVMEDEYSQSIPNMRVLVYDVKMCIRDRGIADISPDKYVL